MKNASHAGRKNRGVGGSLGRAAAIIRRKCPLPPRLGIILGSGFQGVLDTVQARAAVPYSKLPGFPQTSVPGHHGTVVCGRLGGLEVVVLAGRAHYYEGHSMEAVTAGVRLLAQLGVESVLITNAAGGINRRFCVGDFMMLNDHINLMGCNPLRGGAAGGMKFVDMTQAYDPNLQSLLRRAARRSKLPLRSGVYLAVSGPSYETPAEIRAFGRLGADAVGMSTVPEVIVARQQGLRVAALSCITNLAAGIGGTTLSHQEVLDVGVRASKQAARLLEKFAQLHAKN
jgi:purine-nucleoside phosphorylase